ncbi:PMCA-type calcium-translocating P-type ATPase [Basidiobolus meristosporus CBS 931.73]|uniref:Calcium-transporting ATPase n=1 Tax=Basidiobolus meristosporus CBS 931.73 TaxID=1314790 RepID=A0A1Y1Y2B7_9FUNG|nr:PMCA-type calcium-translocating P-type ATPase [Basidiobolus meristosporus CBS 931.73]|eukprot:ORX92128.1 PMCA-type calcium-translocating P-type ATPase [Basidiobolus meristosporus CBS 931.73]
MSPRDSEEQDLLSNDHNGSGSFNVSCEQLCDLFDPKSMDKLKSLGGAEGLAKSLKVDLKAGLSNDEQLSATATGDSDERFDERQEVFGKNVLPSTEQQSFWSLVREAYDDKTLVMLSIAAAVSLAVGIYEDISEDRHPRVGWVEGVAILVAVAVVVFTNAINDYQKEAQFRKLNAKKEDRHVKVIRDGKEQEISVFDIQVGEILLVEPGDIVPVDGIYIDGHNLVCDESSATGESDPLKKNSEKDPFVLSGSKVLEGVGRVIVVAVGPNSYNGKTMMAMREDENQETPLQMKLDILAESIAKLGISAAVLLLVTLVTKYIITSALSDTSPTGAQVFSQMVKILIQAITIVVVAVPEGLPMAVTLALAYATTQMIKDQNLVRVLAACETMGNATTVCSDKTGTLTQNQMTVVAGTVAGETIDDHNKVDEFKSKLSEDLVELLCESIAVNSTAFEGKDDKGEPTFIGSKTESALLKFAQKLGADYNQVRQDAKPIKVYPFASERKTMTTVIPAKAKSPGDKKADFRIHVKGASEIVLDSCTHYVSDDDNVKELDDVAKKNFEKTISDFANNALRTICIAYRDVSQSDVDGFDDSDAPLEKLTCIGIVGIQDPLREGVIDSIAACKRAGVYVRMVTGDNVQTAKAIATKAGIYTKGGIAITGPEFRKLSQDERTKMVPRLQVLARSSPTDKQIVVKTLQELGEVVAVTGDGTNDGPALKMADVGFSMGITGTEVAKEASAIILMDDNFVSIVKALKWGRAVNDSVRKFLQFQLTVNITAVILAFVSAVASADNQSVLTAVQLLWVNLIMDTLAALALATEPPSDDVLERYPTSRDASLINSKMWRMIIGQAIFQIAINLTLLNWGAKLFRLSDMDDPLILQTLVFNSFVFLQVFNELNCRRIDDHLNIFRGITRNYMFIVVQLFVIIGQVIIVEFGGVAFGTTHLNWYQWLSTVFIGSLSLPIGFILRLLPDFGSNGDHRPGYQDQERRPLVSHERMRFQAAARDIINQQRFVSGASGRTSFYGAVRRPTRKVTGTSLRRSTS